MKKVNARDMLPKPEEMTPYATDLDFALAIKEESKAMSHELRGFVASAAAAGWANGKNGEQMPSWDDVAKIAWMTWEARRRGGDGVVEEAGSGDHGDDSIDVEPGDRVYAIESETASEVRAFGGGVYEGMHLPPDGTIGVGGEVLRYHEMTETAVRQLMEQRPESDEETLRWIIADSAPKNPRIRLDSGEIVWGCQCWWGPEETVLGNIESSGKTITEVTVAEYISNARPN